jgi:hypothetical protein
MKSKLTIIQQCYDLKINCNWKYHRETKLGFCDNLKVVLGWWYGGWSMMDALISFTRQCFALKGPTCPQNGHVLIFLNSVGIRDWPSIYKFQTNTLQNIKLSTTQLSLKQLIYVKEKCMWTERTRVQVMYFCIENRCGLGGSQNTKRGELGTLWTPIEAPWSWWRIKLQDQASSDHFPNP